MNAEIKGKERQQDIAVTELKAQVRGHYYQLMYLLHNESKLQYLDTLYADFVNAANIRYKAGETKKLEVSTASTSKVRIKLLLQQNEVYINNAYQQLKTLMNIETDFKVAITDNYQPLEVATFLDSTAIANHPGIQALYQDAIIATQNIKVEQAQNLPDFKIGYNNQSLIGYQNIDNQEVYYGSDRRFSAVNIGIAIPLSIGANKARTQALKYQQQSVQANAEYQQQQLTTQLQNTLQQYKQQLQHISLL